MSAAPWAAHFGLARTPFGKSIPARDLFARQAHAEAIARIGFCVVESALGVVTGDVGAGKTVALRAAVSAWTRPGTRSSTSPTPRSAPAGCMSRSSAPSAPGPATSRPS